MGESWWKKSVVYQIYPRSFCDSNGDGIGDLNGITQRLEYVKLLGADVIWLSPIYKSPNADNGYDISDYQAIMEEFGTLDDFDRLLNKAHELGLKIMMDLVVNHTSDQHPWFLESRKSKDNPYRDYYIWREGRGGDAPNNWGGHFGGSAWEYDEQTQMYYLHLFTPQQPDLNWDNPDVRSSVFQMMTWWCEKGIDGFRMDVIDRISKDESYADGPLRENGYGNAMPYTTNGPHMHEYLREMNREVLSRYDLITVGECAGASVEEACRYASLDGRELNMVFQFDHMHLDGEHTFKWTDKKIRLSELKQVMSKWQTGLYGKAWNSLYWGNHDQPRVVSRFGNDSDKYRELSAKMLGTCLHMMQGTPYIYQGEELGMTNYPFSSIDDFRDIESIQAYEEFALTGKIAPDDMMRRIRYKSRDNARTPMQWSDEDQAGFTGGVPWINVNPNYKEINVKEQIAREDSVFHYYQKLISLRKQYDIIVYGSYSLLLPESETLYVYIRTYKDQIMLVICSFSDEEEEFELPEELSDKTGNILISNYDMSSVTKEMTLHPYEALVVLY